MRVSAKADYALRAALELAAAEGVVKGDSVASAQGIPPKFLENILIELRHAGIVRSQRGPEGGYWLALPASEVKLGDVIRAVEGPLASIRGEPPEDVEFSGPSAHLQNVWIAVCGSLRSVLDEVTLADVVEGKLPKSVERLAGDPEHWVTR